MYIFVGGLPSIGVNQLAVVINLNVAVLTNSLFGLDLKVIPAAFQFAYVFIYI